MRIQQIGIYIKVIPVETPVLVIDHQAVLASGCNIEVHAGSHLCPLAQRVFIGTPVHAYGRATGFVQSFPDNALRIYNAGL